MKKWTKILLRTIGTLLIEIVVGLLKVYYWISNKWTSFYTEDEMQKMANEVEITQPLSDNFYIAYDKIYPKQREKTLAKMSFQTGLYLLKANKETFVDQKQCNCIKITRFFDNKVPSSHHSWAFYITAHGIEKYTTETKCFDFYYRKIGIDSLANMHFQKPLDELTIDENMELILISEKPLFNKKRSDLISKKT